MTTILCFYHSPCNDGSGAAAALRHRLELEGYLGPERDLRYCPLNYTTGWDEPLAESYVEDQIKPDHSVSEIFIVDITFSKVKFDQIIKHLCAIDKMEADGPRVICIDHHETAMRKQEELAVFCDETYIRQGPALSGATLVWHYFNERFNQQRPMPELLRYIADQDIWEWKLPDSEEINAALNTLEGHADSMEEELRTSLEDEAAWHERRRSQGSAIVSMVDAEVKKAAWHALDVPIGDFVLRVLNSANFSSELGNYLCNSSDDKPNAVALIYSIQEDWRVRCSLRSIPGGKMNARQFAERFGGGGHDNAAGCRFETFDELRSTIEQLQATGWSTLR